MASSPQAGHWMGAAIVVLVLALLAIHGDGVVATYGWVLFPGIFAVAIGGRVFEAARRRRELRKFRDDE